MLTNRLPSVNGHAPVLPRLAPPPAPEPAPAPLLVDSATAAKMLAMSERWLWEATRRGSIKKVRMGRVVRYRVADLEAYIDANRS